MSVLGISSRQHDVRGGSVVGRTPTQIVERALELAALPDNKFIELGWELGKLRYIDSKAFTKTAARAGMKQRKAYDLVKIAEVVARLPGYRRRIRNIGWSKAALLCPHLNAGNADRLLALAEATTSAQLAAHLRGLSASEAKGKRHCMTLYFSQGQYEELSTTLIKHGAVPTARGLARKEDALIKALGRQAAAKGE
jgi:hypothetical protein